MQMGTCRSVDKKCMPCIKSVKKSSRFYEDCYLRNNQDKRYWIAHNIINHFITLYDHLREMQSHDVHRKQMTSKSHSERSWAGHENDKPCIIAIMNCSLLQWWTVHYSNNAQFEYCYSCCCCHSKKQHKCKSK